MGLCESLDAIVAWHVEKDKDASRVLAERWPGVPNYSDVTKIDWGTVEPVDVICGGPPCQPASNAGKRLGVNDERWMWPAALEAVRALRPRVAIMENPSAVLSLDGGRPWGWILASLGEAGYECWWRCLRASDFGAPHRRERVFLVAVASDLVADTERHLLTRPGPGEVLGPTRTGEGDGRERERVRSLAGDGDQPAPNAWRPEVEPGGHGLDLAPDTDVLGCSGAGTFAEQEGGGEPPNGPTRERERERESPSDPDSEGLEGIESTLGCLVPSGSDQVDWDSTIYGPAIRRWEAINGPAPDPLRNGSLNADFEEWMMGIPIGWTDIGISQTGRKRCVGNAVVVPCAEAIGHWVTSLLTDAQRLSRATVPLTPLQRQTMLPTPTQYLV